MADDPGDLPPRQHRLKTQFVEELGYWSPAHEDVLRLDPDFFEHYLDIIAHPHRSGALEPKVREFMLIAVNCVTTQLHGEGTRIHVRRALEHGATFEEIREVFQRTSGLGVHSVTAGVQILNDVAGPSPEPDGAGRAEQQRLRATFEEKRGYWNEVWEAVLRTDPGFFQHYTALSSHPYEHGPLEAKVEEFLSIAYDSSTTNLFHPGLRGHIENALDHGASREEIMEVLELAAIVGFHTLTEGAPVLIEEARRQNALPDSWQGDVE